MSGYATQPNRNARRGFTLVELVVVVLILGILAAVAAPRMFDTAGNARDSSTRQSLGVVRDAIQLYKAREGSYPSAATLSADLKTYLNGPFPAAQVGNTNADVGSFDSTAAELAVSGGTEGWAYDPATGAFVINHADYINW